MFEVICNHIKYATNKGVLRSSITIMPQRIAGREDYRVWNQQLISFAGYSDEGGGKIIGDPINVEFTKVGFFKILYTIFFTPSFTLLLLFFTLFQLKLFKTFFASFISFMQNREKNAF